MRVNNSLQRQNSSKPKFSVAIQTPMYQKLVNDTLGDPERARRFVASISSAVAVNPALQECDAGTVLTAALLGESLNLSPSPQLGQYYMVPYNDKKRGKVAQFQIGYKGYIQLAERSGQYLDLDAFPVVEGEYKGRDRFTRRPILEFLEDDGERENRPVERHYRETRRPMTETMWRERSRPCAATPGTCKRTWTLCWGRSKRTRRRCSKASPPRGSASQR